MAGREPRALRKSGWGRSTGLDDDSVVLSSQLASSLGVRVGDKVEIYSPLLIEKLKNDEVFLPREVTCDRRALDRAPATRQQHDLRDVARGAGTLRPRAQRARHLCAG
jgi:hypothetical protein